MENKKVQKIMAEDHSIATRQSSSDRSKVFEELNRLLEEFLAKSSSVQDSEQFGTSDTEMTFPGLRVATGNYDGTGKTYQHYTHIQLDQGVITEDSPIAIRMAKIVEIKAKNQNKTVQGTQAFFSLFSQLKGSAKEEFMEKALDFACNIQYGDLRAEVLSMLVPVLEGPKKVEFIKKALYSTSNIADEAERSLVLSSLARHFRGSGKEELLERIFEFSYYIEYGDAKFQILSSLIPHLYGSKNEAIMEKALELVIIPQYQRVESYSLLLPYLNEQKKEEVIGQALELASNLKDKDMIPQALSLIIPYLDEPGQKEILGKALNLARGIHSQYRRKQALSSLAPYLKEPEE